MSKFIPDRWQNYKPIGQRVEGTRFIAFKVPLNEEISNKVDSDIRLDDKLLLKMIPNLGLIIDLTNTHRYYNPEVFFKKGIRHIKLMIPGHQTPPKHLSDEFNKIVTEFLLRNTINDKLIGVHCTHGVNRTGFLICNFMISKMNFEPNEALKRFSNARGYEIERNNYIDALHKLPETNAHKSTDRNLKNPHPDKRVVGRGDYEEPGSYYRDRHHRYIRSQNNDDSRSNNWRERSRSPQPPPYHGRNNTRNNNRDQFVRRPHYLPRQSSQGLLERPHVNQPTHLRLDYYNTRPLNKSQHNRHLTR